MPVPLVLSNPACIAPVQDWCGEGALWRPQEQALYWTDINRFLIHRWEMHSHAVSTWQFAEPVTALALTTRVDLLLVVLASRIILWRPSAVGQANEAENEVIYVLPEWPEVRGNDARVDPAGVLWVATMQNNVAPDGASLPVNEGLGSLFSLNASGQAQIWRTKLLIGNTLAWSPDRRFMYSADTLANEIRRYDWSSDGSIANEVPWFRGDGGNAAGLPDGSAMDSDGYLWNCRYGGGCILRIDPEGRIDRVISMPVKNPTTCVFGGADLTTLYVTSAALGDDQSLAGSVFAIETNVRGLPGNQFRLQTGRANPV
jgi:sugar lactone lactonase YvrE